MLLAAGAFLGGSFLKPLNKSTNTALQNSVYKFHEIFEHIDKEYVDTVSFNAISEAAIPKMLEALDPHSVYIPQKELALKNVALDGELEGIGIEFTILKDTIYIIAPINGGPSEKVGIQTGDRIVKIEGQDFTGSRLTARGAVEKLRGPKGTKVNVTIKRSGQKALLDTTITRDKIPYYSVDISYMINDEVGYMKISRFTANTYKEFQQGLDKLVGQGMEKLIIDLQSNPGGYLDRAAKIVDELLEPGRLIVYTKGRSKRHNSLFYTQQNGSFEKNPVIVLINEGSASAPEIVAGALQDNDRALIVGRRSFGKGLVQTPILLRDGSALHLTVAKYFTPSGRCIQKPYNKETDSYQLDLLHRYTHGEYFHADSIHLNDSLKFQTKKGRPVYGGGGIMPDYFIPLDTSMHTAYLSKLYSKNVVYEYAIHYAEKNRAALQARGYQHYYQHFEVNELMLTDFIAKAKAVGIAYHRPAFRTSQPLIKMLLKAHIARNIWQEQGFYPIYNQSDELVQQALKLFDKAAALLVPVADDKNKQTPL